MPLRRLLPSLAILALLPLSLGAAAQSPLTTDPTPNQSAPAAMQSFQLPSHGALLNALFYIASGPGPHPAVILLHGFPGNERNLDLAQTLRRAGYDVLYFDYRGSWGSPGDFSLAHSIEDTNSAIAYLRDPANAQKLRADPTNIILIGHSMGGFIARYAAAQDPAIKAVALISAADMGVDTVESIPLARRNVTIDPMATHFAAEGMAPLAGVTPKSLAQEIVANADTWNIPSLAPKLATRPLLIITSDDGLTRSNDAFVAALPKSTAPALTTLHIATDHAYSDHRIALQQAILDFLTHLPTK
jgi:uncharacterized protein